MALPGPAPKVHPHLWLLHCLSGTRELSFPPKTAADQAKLSQMGQGEPGGVAEHCWAGLGSKGQCVGVKGQGVCRHQHATPNPSPPCAGPSTSGHALTQHLCHPQPLPMSVGYLQPQPLHARTQCPHLRGASASTQVIAELPSEAPAEAWGKLRVQRQALMQPGQLQTLQDTVGQPLHIRIGLDYLLTPGQLTANQITLPWGEETEVSGLSHWEEEQNGGAGLPSWADGAFPASSYYTKRS